MLWDLMENVQLETDTEDTTFWSWEANGSFSVRTAYAAKFWGKEVTPTADFTWKSKAPLRCRFFAWTVFQNRCWTSDRLARRGLDHQDTCPFYDQEEESINHILVGCVLAREIWTAICLALDKPEWTPGPHTVLAEWCNTMTGTRLCMRDVRALVMLVMWELWKHRNAIVFDGATPSWLHVIARIVAEGRIWKRAGIFKGDVEALLVGVERWTRERT